MKVVINQPTYLPWLGYFDLIDQANLFVVLDNVQFVKQSWQQRNRIKTPTGLQWLTVPVQFRGRLGQVLLEVEIRDSAFARDHLRAIELAYRRSPHFAGYYPALAAIIEKRSAGRLLDLNLDLIEWMIQKLEITTPMVRASSLGLQGKRAELLAGICERVGAEEYLSPVGSAGYLLEEHGALTSRGIEVTFHNYEHPQYEQLFGFFAPYTSLLDLLFNHGRDSLRILRSGRREAHSLTEMAAIQHSAGLGNEADPTVLAV